MRNQTIVNHMFDALESGLVDEVTKGDKVMDLLMKQIGLGKDIAKIWLKKFSSHGTKASRSRSRFIKDNQDWLMEEIQEEKPMEIDNVCVKGEKSKGRPRKSFEDASSKTQKKQAEKDNSDKSLHQVLMQSYYKLKDEGRELDAQIIKKMMKSEKDGSCIQTECYSCTEALALLLDCRLSKLDYQSLRNGALEKGNNLYPSYNNIRNEKKRCIPKSPEGIEDGIKAGDYYASVDLQDGLYILFIKI